MKKVFYVLLAVYVILYSTLFRVYNYPNYTYSSFFWCIAWLPLLVLPVVLLYPKAYEILGRLVKLKAWIIASISLMVSCSILHMLEIRPIWGAFTSIALTFASLVLALCLMDERGEKGRSLLTGIGLVWIAEGALEVIYKTGWITFYYSFYPQGYRRYVFDMIEVAMWLFVGWLTLHIAKRESGILHINHAFYFLVVVGIATTGIWYATGFHVADFARYNNYNNSLTAGVNRLWRASITLAPMMLLLRERRQEKGEGLLNHSSLAAAKCSHDSIPSTDIRDGQNQEEQNGRALF